MKILLHSFLILFFFSCATREKYKKKLESWVGSKEKELVQSWGPPDSVYQLSNSEKMLTYTRSRVVTRPGTDPSYRTKMDVDGTVHTKPYGGRPPRTVIRHCKTIFTVKNEIISHWKFDGNSCKSR